MNRRVKRLLNSQQRSSITPGVDHVDTAPMKVLQILSRGCRTAAGNSGDLAIKPADSLADRGAMDCNGRVGLRGISVKGKYPVAKKALEYANTDIDDKSNWSFGSGYDENVRNPRFA